jgi:hypothetical protein
LKQLIEELNAENFNLLQGFEFRHINVRALGYVKEDSIDEIEEDFKLKVLTPRETKVEEELREAFKLN